MPSLRTRFAPSPTGYLHLGHAASAWHVWHMAERLGAKTLLRIEDIDTARCRSAYIDAIYTDLSWLGFDWPEPVRQQSQHFADYQASVQTLAGQGLAYRCFRTRAELNASAYPFQGRALAASEEAARLERGERFAWRLSMRAARDALGPVWNELSFSQWDGAKCVTVQAMPDCEGDIVIARKDSPSAYHLAATQDDAEQGITHIMRGEDLKSAAHVQTLLQILMGWPQPVYAHHGLICDTDGRKLSKRAHSPALGTLRASGITPQQIWTRLHLD